MNRFKSTRESFKLYQRVETAANVSDTNSIAANEKITTRWDIPLDKQYARRSYRAVLSKRFGANHISCKRSKKEREPASMYRIADFGNCLCSSMRRTF